MEQSEASRHQPAGEPLSLQADAAGDVRGRQSAPQIMRAGMSPTSRSKKSVALRLISGGPAGSREQVLATNAFRCFLSVWLLV